MVFRLVQGAVGKHTGLVQDQTFYIIATSQPQPLTACITMQHWEIQVYLGSGLPSEAEGGYNTVCTP